MNKLINVIKRFFQPAFKLKSSILQRGEDLNDAIEKNRASLKTIDDWIDKEAFKKSWFHYGVPDFIHNDINKEINRDPTYTDLMLLISNKYFPSLNYLEIGVSVGKNFFQLMNSLTPVWMTGFDIEEINPVVERMLELENKKEWITPKSSIKKSLSSITTYKFRDNEIKYICADVWDENAWANLSGNKYNLIFSDALHSSEAILFEFKMLVKYKLLAENFVIVWDDLTGKMKSAFIKIIKKYHEQYNIQDTYLIQINGWIGQHEGPHSVGIIANFPMT